MPNRVPSFRLHVPSQKLARVLADWFGKHARDLPWRRDPSPYRVWISEIMLQQTQVATVIPYFERFIARFPDVRALAVADEQDVLALWSGLGYYRRARMLHQAAREIVEKHGGEFPIEREAILALPGIGRYTAGAILSIAFNRAEPIVDGNVARVFARIAREKHTITSKEALAAAWAWAETLVRTKGAKPRALNQALMELGATVCTPASPQCESCPVAKFCEARQHAQVSRFPRVERKPAFKSIRYFALLTTDKRGRVLLVKRGTDQPSLLPDGLWELPAGENVATRQGDKAAATVRQTIMNWKVELVVLNGVAQDLPQTRRWFEKTEFAAVPMASITRKALEAAMRVADKPGFRKFGAP